MAGDFMIASINKSIAICNTNIHVDTISINKSTSKEKTYYQHRHPGIEIHYIADGEFKVNCAERYFLLSSNTLILIPAGTYHDITAIKENATKLSFSFMIHKSNNINPGSNSNIFYSTYTKSEPIIANLQDSEAKTILQRMIMLLNKDQDNQFLADKLLSLCGSLLLELIPDVMNTDSNSITAESVQIQEDISFKIDSFMGRNFMHNDAKSRMADDLYISPRQLQRIIQKNYGMSYREKLTETRIQIAVDLLRNTDMSINKISEILGYSCSANFSAFIKRNTGKTPTQIRKV